MAWVASAVYAGTVATVGAVGASVLAGAATGALISGATTLVTGGSVGDNMLKGAVVGGITGGIAGGIGSLANAGTQGMLTTEQVASLAGNPAALAEYQAAGMIPQSTLTAANNAWNALPEGARQSYLDSGYSPVAIGSAALNDASSAGMLGNVKDAFQAKGMVNQLVSGAMQLGGSYLNNKSFQDASATQAQAQIRAAQIAADAAKFRPVGVTTRFGQSQFGYDANGNLVSAGYNLSPEVKAQQDALMGVSNNMLSQYQGAQQATAPMGQAAQTMFGLGQGYLNQTPQQQAAQYMAEQQALLAPSRATGMANLQNTLANQGTGGLAVGGGNGMLASNPQMAAYLNAQQMQDLQLAANATQGGMDYAKFGAGMVGSGGQMLNSMYGTQNAAYQPYETALGGAANIENLGQNAMGLGTSIGAKSSTAQAQAGLLQAQGMTNAANTMAQANAINPWGGLLSGGANILQNYNNQQNNPYAMLQQQGWTLNAVPPKG